jgi:large repetitive protein
MTFSAPESGSLVKGVYLITVTAADNSTPPITGSATFSVTVTDSTDTSTVTASATPVASSTFGDANSAVTTITPGGGTPPYTYAMTSVPGISISSDGVVTTTSAAGAATYLMDVTVTDSSLSPETRDIYFNVPIALALSSSNGTYPSGSASSANSSLTTISATGATGTVSYSLLNATINSCNFAVGTTSGVVSTAGPCTADLYFVTVIATDGASASGPFSPATTSINLAVQLN